MKTSRVGENFVKLLQVPMGMTSFSYCLLERIRIMIIDDHKIRRAARLPILGFVIAVITAQHYIVDVSHENLSIHNIHYLLYFLPILMGAIWYGLLGGTITAILVSLLYMPIVFGPIGRHVFGSSTEQIIGLGIYNVVGWVTGLLSERERRESNRYRKTAEELQGAYQRLREQTDLIIEKEEQLRRAERLSTLGELAAGIAHEIRNPLASIKGTAEIIMDASTPMEKKEEFAQLMLDESNRLNSVVTNFLELARFRRLNREEADINDMLWRMLQIADLQLGRSNITVRTIFAPELPKLNLDISQIEHAILNIILNSASAMPDGGTLRLTTKLQNHKGSEEVIIEIADTGTGIMSEHLPHIFEPFFTTKDDGTGLGLSIVNRIIKAHGGSVNISSNQGEGTITTITLPLDAEDIR